MLQLGFASAGTTGSVDWRLIAVVAVVAVFTVITALALGFGVVAILRRPGDGVTAGPSKSVKHDATKDAWAQIRRAVLLCGLGGASILASAALVGVMVAQILSVGGAVGPQGSAFGVLAVLVGVVGACVIVPWADRAALRASDMLRVSSLDVPSDRSPGVGAITRRAA